MIIIRPVIASNTRKLACRYTKTSNSWPANHLSHFTVIAINIITVLQRFAICLCFASFLNVKI